MTDEMHECIFLEDGICQLCDDGRDCPCAQFISMLDWIRLKEKDDEKING